MDECYEYLVNILWKMRVNFHIADKFCLNLTVYDGNVHRLMLVYNLQKSNFLICLSIYKMIAWNDA